MMMVLVGCLVVCLVSFSSRNSVSQASSAAPGVVLGIARVGNYVLTRDSEGAAAAGAANCSSASGWCAAERLGRFAVVCPCAVSSLNGVAVPEVGSWAGKSVFLAACSMVRGDDAYLKEWVEYHLEHQGIELFVLYLDEEVEERREATKRLLSVFGSSVQVVETRVWSGLRERQFVAMNHCVHQVMRGRAEWVAVFDVDEFFVPMQFESLKEAVVALSDETVGSLFVPQAFFGSGGSSSSSGSVLSRFRFRESSFVAGSHVSGRLVGKSVIRQRFFRHMHTVHTCESSRRRVTVSANDVRINHYVCKTREEQRAREKEGAAWFSKLANRWEELCENLFVKVRDDSIERFV